jgi:hypothetical protein
VAAGRPQFEIAQIAGVVEADFFGWMLDVPGGEGSELGRQAEELAAALPLDLTLHFVALRRRSAIISPNSEPQLAHFKARARPYSLRRHHRRRATVVLAWTLHGGLNRSGSV